MNEFITVDTEVIDLGLTPYQTAWDLQTNLFQQIINIKKQNQKTAIGKPLPTKNYLLICEHPHVFTLGNRGNENNLLIKIESLSSIHAELIPSNRGGDITYHGPGQIVLYPVIDLENFFTDIHRYLRSLEEAVIQTLSYFSIVGERIAGLTGVWVDVKNNPRKICALGVKTSRWVAMHGLALNVNTDNKYFGYIIPCGVAGKAITSMQHELASLQDMEKVKYHLLEKVLSIFGMQKIVSL